MYESGVLLGVSGRCLENQPAAFKSIFSAMISFAVRLAAFDRRLTSFHKNESYIWLSPVSQLRVHSDFYHYIRSNIEKLKTELGVLLFDYRVCRSNGFGISKEPVAQSIELNIIRFPRASDGISSVDLDRLLEKGDQLMNDLQALFLKVNEKAGEIVAHLRSQF